MKALGLGLAALAASGCASMLPQQTVDGVAIYERPAAEVQSYCTPRVKPEQRGPHMFGCYVPRERTIVYETGYTEVRDHELRHAQGWDHVGACHSSKANPDGLTPAGQPCQWYRR